MSRPEHDTQLPQTSRRILEEDGYTAEFGMGPDATVQCPGCGDARQPEELRLERIARYEGVSDPDDEQSDMGISCSVCGTKGILTSAYGPDASADEGDVMRRMVDVRH